jgi:transcriptional regulator with XRE-family HTH domain
MSADAAELKMLGERIARVRQTYGDNIDLPNLGPTLFAVLLGASVLTYESYERGESEPTVDFLIALRKQTGVSLDWLLDPDQAAPDRTFR